MNPHLRRVAYLNLVLGVVLAVGIALVWLLSQGVWEAVASSGLLPLSYRMLQATFAALVGVGVLQAAGGLALLVGARSAVPLLWVASVLGLMSPPIGMAVAIYTLWFLVTQSRQTSHVAST